VVFDCATSSSELIESALYGHVKGAFTGADVEQLGAVAQARGGTLLLDGVSELPPNEQPKLLRLIGSREYRPVGASATVAADVRILASTQEDLDLAVTRGTFRRDLYFRLAVANLEMPPLRARIEDIPALVASFTRGLTGHALELSPETVASFQFREWSGNVRELKNAVERALTLGAAELAPTELPPSASLADLMLKVEHDYLVALLERHPDNMSAAARDAKIARSQLYRLLAKHGLSTPE
jgi:DNA-binding NtrC family response regulator